MKKAILIGLISGAASIAAAVPALAQPFSARPPFVETRLGDIDARIGRIDFRIDEAVRRGFIDFRGAQRLRSELAAIRWLERRDRFENSGRLAPWARMQLSERLDGLAAQLNFEGR